MAEKKKGTEAAAALKEEGNAHYMSGNYLKAAAVYTQAIKADSNRATLYSNRSAAFLNLVKVTKALADAEMTIKLNPAWEKGYFRKGCALEAAERYEEVCFSEKTSGPKIPENIDELFNFLKGTVETSVQTWDNTNGVKLDPGVRFLIPKESSSSTDVAHVTVKKAGSQQESALPWLSNSSFSESLLPPPSVPSPLEASFSGAEVAEKDLDNVQHQGAVSSSDLESSTDEDA